MTLEALHVPGKADRIKNSSPQAMDPEDLAVRYVTRRYDVSVSVAKTIARLASLGGAA